jgi:hypothetical protein
LPLGCSSPEKGGSNDDSDASDGFDAVVTPFPTMVNEATVDISLAEPHAIAVTCEAPTDDPWPERIVVRSADSQTEHSVFLQALLADTTYTCRVTDDRTVLGTFDVTTPPLPDAISFADATVEFDDPTAFVPGWTLYNPTAWRDNLPSYGADLVVDPMGRVRWYQDIAGYDSDGIFEYDAAHKEFYAGGGSLSIQPLTSWDLAGNTLLSWANVGADHDIEKVGPDYWIVTPGDDGIGGNHCLDQRSSEKQLLWEWCTDDSDVVPDSPANSIAIDTTPDGVFLYVTMQIKGIVYKLERNTKRVVWTFSEGGDFTGDVPYDDWMHDIHVVPCAGYTECLIFYANGNEKDPTTSIRKIGIDEDTMTATLVREWTEPGWQEPKLGGIDPFSEHWLIAEGHFLPDPLSNSPSQLVEVAADDSVAWRLTVKDKNISVYRARRVSACDLFDHAGYCQSIETP